MTQAGGCCSPALCQENPRQICAFRQKYGSVAVLGRFFSEKTCNFGANVIILYPTRGRVLGYISFPRHTLVFLSSFFCYFLHLPSYHLPCCSRKGARKAMTHPAPGHRLFFFVLVWLLFSGSGLQRPAGRRRKNRAFPVRRPGLFRPVPMRVQHLPRCWGRLPL